MRTFGIDVAMEPLKGDSGDDLESNRISFDSIAVTGESFMWPLFKHFVKTFSKFTRPLLDRGGIQASNSTKPLIRARLGTIVYGRLVRRPPKY